MKTVPVVVYENGKRSVVGTANVNVEGQYVAIVAEISAAFAERIGEDLYQLSFGPLDVHRPKPNKE